MISSWQEVIWKTCITTQFGHVNTCLETAFRYQYRFEFRVSSNLGTVRSGSINASEHMSFADPHIGEQAIVMQ